MTDLSALSDADLMGMISAPAQTSGGPLRITVRPPGAMSDQELLAALNGPSRMSTGEDMARSAGSGLVKGAAGLIGLPDAIGNLGAAGMRGVQSLVERMGVPGPTPQPAPAPNTMGTQGLAGASGSIPRSILPTTQDALDLFQKGTGPLHEPQTTAGHYAQTAAEFVPGAVLAPGGMVGNAVRYGILPGLASEGAGQATKGTQYEQPARVGAALATGGAAGLMSRPGSAAQSIRNQLPANVTPQMVDGARTLIADAAQHGITLSWPEALSQVAQRPVLSEMARHLEGAQQTTGRMADFYAPRANQVDVAARTQFDGLSPVNQAPSTIGHQAGHAAEGIVTDVRGAINNVAAPHYRAAEGILLNPQEMAQVRALPGYAEARDAVRNEPQLNRYVAHLPENSVGFLNEVKKQLDQSARNATAPLGPRGAPNAQIGAGYTRDATTARQVGVNASANYGDALAIEEHGRRQFLDPLLQGPLGKMASRDTTTKQAIEALFPKNPLANSQQEIATAVGALAHRNPNIAGDLVRAHAESVFNQATRDLQPGANLAGGAKFRVALVGNPQQAANFEAAVTALPFGAQRLAGFNRFLDIMEAVGTRQNVGSKTAYNAEFLKNASSSGLVGEAAKGAANPISRFTAGFIDKYEQWRLGRNLNELADILTNPAAVGQLRAIARMPPGSQQALTVANRLAMLTRSSSTSGQPVNQSRQ